MTEINDEDFWEAFRNKVSQDKSVWGDNISLCSEESVKLCSWYKYPSVSMARYLFTNMKILLQHYEAACMVVKSVLSPYILLCYCETGCRVYSENLDSLVKMAPSAKGGVFQGCFSGNSCFRLYLLMTQVFYVKQDVQL